MKYISSAVVAIAMLTLIGCGADTSSQTGIATTPSNLQGPDALVYAAQGGDLATVKQVLGQDPSLIEAQDQSGNTILHIAAGYNRLNVVEYLLAQGANPNIENYDGLNCYDYADAENADREVLEALTQ